MTAKDRFAVTRRRQELTEPRYEVIVGNIGTVYSGDDPSCAVRTYREYVSLSANGEGRAGYEDVTLFIKGEVEKHHSGREFNLG